MPLTLEQLKIQITGDLACSDNLVSVYNNEIMRRNLGQKTKAQEKFRLEMGPYSSDYFLPIHSLFLFGEKNKHLLGSQDYFLIRDGLYTLLDFFHHHPTPKDISSIFIIHQRLASFVPLTWKKQVAFYNYEIPQAKIKDKIILSGLLNNNFVSLKAFEKKLDKIIEKYPHNKDFMALLTHRTDLFLGESQTGLSPIFDYCKILHQKLGTNIDFVSPEQVENFSIHEYSYVDFNENLLTIADDYMIHLLLSKGATPLFSHPIQIFDDDIVIPCSPCHCLRLSFQEPSWAISTDEKISKFKKIIGMDNLVNENSKFIGPSPDFFLFCRDLSHEILKQDNE